MLRTDVMDVLNSGSAWAIVGSGASIDAGCPSWGGLALAIAASLPPGSRLKAAPGSEFEGYLKRGDYLQAFSELENASSRSDVERAVHAELGRHPRPGKITSLLATFPFKGYVTTNYDSLLETALVERGHAGWLTVGNEGDEPRKVAGGASDLIWHVHGATSLDPAKSRLVLTQSDYDRYYLEDSLVVQQLKGLLAHHRLVVVGYGFGDPEVTRVLRRIGKLANPARPIYAFLGGVDGSKYAGERQRWLAQYNVDIIPYRIVEDSHEVLLELLQAYSSFVVPRAQRFSGVRTAAPTHDPDTTALLLYNDLCLKPGGVSGEAFDALLRARVLSLLKFNGACPVRAFLDELEARAKVLGGHRATAEEGSEKFRSLLVKLVREGLIELSGQGDAATVGLTDTGHKAVRNQAASAEVLSGQFRSSLKARAVTFGRLSGEAQDRVAVVAETFLAECIDRRALGVALVAFTTRDEHKSYHMVALLQALPRYFGTLTSNDEALALISVVRGFLTRATDAERRFLGTALQAKFGVHLLGYDPAALEARRRELQNTLFLVDSSTLIPFLARGCSGNEFAVLLLEKLNGNGALVATTTLLAEEVAEHARWALSKVDEAGRPGLETLKAETGKAGDRMNGFLDGFVEEIAIGRTGSDFHAYLRGICGFPAKTYYSGDDLQETLERRSIHCRPFDKWDNFDLVMFAERDEVQEEIRRRRQERATFRHDRQVQAEAEALILVRRARKTGKAIAGMAVSGAYFLSRTRVIDEVAGGGYALTMRPEAAIQLLNTLAPCTPTELAGLTNSLLWELAERGLAFVDSAKLLTVFSPLIDASRQRLDDELERYRALVSDRFGEESAQAFRDAPALDVPFLVDTYFAQRATALEAQLRQEQERASKAEAVARLSDKERRELARLTEKERQARAEAKRKKRAAESRKGKRRKRH